MRPAQLHRLPDSQPVALGPLLCAAVLAGAAIGVLAGGLVAAAIALAPAIHWSAP